jgi:hypothetical protein
MLPGQIPPTIGISFCLICIRSDTNLITNGEGSLEDGRVAAQTRPIEFRLEALSTVSFADEDSTHHGVDAPNRRCSKSATI